MSVNKGKNVELMKGEAVTQAHALGCAVACVAFLTGTSYRRALKRFPFPHFAWTRGFYCSEIVAALKDAGFCYRWRKIKSTGRNLHIPNESIIFVGKSERYQFGHFLVKCDARRYMNPWKNCPDMIPAKGGFDAVLPGKILYVVEREDA